MTNAKKKKIYGEGNVNDQMYQKWFTNFCAQDFSLNIVPWLD